MICEIVTSEARVWRFPTALVNCPSGKRMTGGGGQCTSDIGWTWVTTNRPENDNTWRVACDTSQNIYVTAQAYAVCI